MKKVREATRRLMAFGITVMLIAGSIPQTVYAAGTADTQDPIALSETTPESGEESSKDAEVVDNSDEGSSAILPSDDEVKEPSKDPDGSEEVTDAPKEPDDNPEEEETSGEQGAHENGELSEDEDATEESSEEELSEDSEEELLDEDKKDSEEDKLFGATELTGIDKTIAGLGTMPIADPVGTSSKDDPWKGSYVYYGKYEGTPVKYRMLDKTGGLLDCDTILFKSQFDDDNNVYRWDDSDLRRNLNGELFLEKDGVFTTTEKDALVPLTSSYEFAGGEKVYLLDLYETMEARYGYCAVWGESNSRIKNYGGSSARWWTRLWNDGYKKPFYVEHNGDTDTARVLPATSELGVSPVFTIDDSAIVFSSLIRSTESSPGAGEIGAEYALTLVDDGLSIELTERPSYVGGNMTIPCKVTDNSDVSSPEYVRVISVKEGFSVSWTGNGWEYEEQYSDDNRTLNQICDVSEKIDIQEIIDTGKIVVPNHYFNIDNCYVVVVDENDIFETDYASAPLKLTGFFEDHSDVSSTNYVKQGFNSIDLSSVTERGGEISITGYDDPSGIISGDITVSGSKLNVNIHDGIGTGKSAIVSLRVGESENYSPYEISLTLIVADKTICGLGTEIIPNPELPLDRDSSWTGSYVYYGKYDGNVVKYRTLCSKTDSFTADSGRKTLFLDCDKLLYETLFDKDGEPNPGAVSSNEWEYSDARRNLNGEEFFLKEGVFTDSEIEAIADSKIDSSIIDKVFFLSIEDVQNGIYGYAGGGSVSICKERISLSRRWLLRSPYNLGNKVFCIYTPSRVRGVIAEEPTNEYFYACPAFNVDLSSVVFSSLNWSSDSHKGAGETGAEYTLALKDDGLGIKATSAPKISGKQVSIPYAVTDSSDESSPDYVMAVVTDGIWTGYGWSDGAQLLQCEKQPVSGAKGTISFSLDSSISGDYNIYLVAMDESCPYESDYASAPAAASVRTILADVTGYEGIYDSNAHGIKVDVKFPETGATVKYGTKEGTYNLTTSPTITDVSDSPLTVYYQITAPGLATKTGSATVVLNKADPSLTAPTARTGLRYDGTDQLLVTNGYSDGGTVCYKVTEKGEPEPPVQYFKPDLPMGKDAKYYDVWYMVKGDKNHKDISPAKLEVSIERGYFTGNYNFYINAPVRTAVKDADYLLPELKSGERYVYTSMSGRPIIDGTPRIGSDGRTLYFNLKSAEAGQHATMYFDVIVPQESNYRDYTISLKVTITDKPGTIAIIEGGDRTATYGDPPFKLTGKVLSGAGDGVWTWQAELTDIITVDSSTGEVTIKRPGQAEIIGTYTSESETETVAISLVVKKKVLGVDWSNTELIYNGSPQKPTAVLTGVKSGDDCTVTVTGEKTDIGRGYVATATLSGRSSSYYVLDSSQDTCFFSIGKAELTEEMVSLGDPLTYNGNRQTQNVVVKYGDSDITDQCVVTGNTASDAGTYTLTVSGKAGGSVTGSVTKEFTIAKKAKDPSVSVSGSYTYTGSPVEPTFTVKDPDTGKVLSDSEYHFEFANNLNAGKGKIIITAAEDGNYFFSEKTVEFDIGKGRWNGETTASAAKNYVYNEEISDGIDLSDSVPEGLGEISFSKPVTSGSISYAQGKAPRIEGNILIYTLKAGDKTASGTITVKAESQNYKNEFTITITIRQQAMGLIEKNKNASVLRISKELTVGKSFTLTPTFLDEGVTNTRVVWSSSNPDVACVNQDGKVTALSAGYAVITAVSEYSSDEVFSQCSVTVTEPVTSITLDKKSYTFGVGEIVTISAAVLPLTAVQPLEWTSNNENVFVVVSDDGLSAAVTGVSEGKAVVTAAAADDSGKKMTCSFTVGNAVPDFNVLTKGNATVLAAGKTLAMQIDWGGKALTPKNTGVTWSVVKEDEETDGSGIATVNEKGVLTGKSEGRVRVVATSTANPAKKFMSPVITVYVPVKSAALNMTSATVSQASDGNGVQLGVNVTSAVAGKEATGTDLGSGPSVIWAVDPNPRYADSLTVSDDGFVVAGAKAVNNVPVVATIKAFNGYEKKLTCKVSVKAANPLKGIKISRTSLSVGEGNTATLTAGLNPVNPDGDTGYTWESSDASIAGVDADGKVTALKPGNATITVKANGTVTAKGKAVNPTAVCKVTVTPSVKAIEFTNANALKDKGLNKGKTYTLKTKFTLSQSKGKAATTALLWTSSDERIATVTQKGVVKAVAPGTVTITATSADSKASGKAPSVAVTFTAYSAVTRVSIDKSKLTIGTQNGSNFGKVSVSAVQPEDVTNPSIIWTVSGKNVALSAVGRNASPSQGIFGEAGASVTTREGEALAVKGLLPGVVKLTGVTTDGSNKKVTCTVTVRGKVTGLTLKAASANVKAGGSASITPVIDIEGISGTATARADKAAYAAYKKYTDVSVSYRSSNTSVATVASNGKVKVTKSAQPGDSATIYVTSADGKYKAEYTITVVK